MFKRYVYFTLLKTRFHILDYQCNVAHEISVALEFFLEINKRTYYLAFQMTCS